jgi:hypothetical protein
MAATFDSITAIPLSVRLAVSCWLMIALAVAVRTVVEPQHHTVVPILANSAEHWWTDRPLYADYKPLDYYRYSPAFAVAATPLWLLGGRAGGIAWTVLNLGVYAAGLGRFRRDVLPGSWTPGRESLFFVLAAAGGLRGFWNGQSNALTVGLLLLGAAALARKHWWGAALWLAVPVLVKVTPVAVALPFCLLWPRRLAGRLALLLAVGLLLPFLTKSPDAVLGYYGEWVGHLTGSSGERWLGFRDGWTVWLLFRHVLLGASGELPLRAAIDAPWYRAVQLATALAVLGWPLYLIRRGCDRRLLINVALGLGATWLMVCGPASEHATYVYLAPTLAWALVDPDAWPRGRWLTRATGLLVLVLGWGTLARALDSVLLLGALPVGATLLAVWLTCYSVAALARPVGKPLAAQRTFARPGLLSVDTNGRIHSHR